MLKKKKKKYRSPGTAAPCNPQSPWEYVAFMVLTPSERDLLTLALFHLSLLCNQVSSTWWLA